MRHLKELVSYLKGTSHYAVVLQRPHGGQGLHKQTNDKYWLLESFSDSDWSSDKRHRRSTSSGPSYAVWQPCLLKFMHPEGHFLFRAAKLNYMEWFQLSLMGFSSGVALSL